ncbi:MAG: DNA-binding protein [Rhodoferax sp.]|nr:DNA-binding protein [Rhodoferax sp.]
METAHFPPLESVTAPIVTTAQAAHYLNRAKQTLRMWASDGRGPIRPVRLNGRLGWPTKEIRRVPGAALA